MAKSNIVRQKKGRGRPPLLLASDGKSPTITIRLPKPLIGDLDRLAKEQGLSRSDIVRRLIELALDAQPQAKKNKR